MKNDHEAYVEDGERHSRMKYFNNVINFSILKEDEEKLVIVNIPICFAWIYPDHRGDSSIYAIKGLASTWHKREMMTKSLTAANRTMRQGDTILEKYCTSGKRRRSFFVMEWGKLAKSLLS